MGSDVCDGVDRLQYYANRIESMTRVSSVCFVCVSLSLNSGR